MTLGGDNERRRIKKDSIKQEKRTAKNYRGSRTVSSGAVWFSKNDVRTEKFLIENKFTNNAKSYTVKFDELKDVVTRAVLEGRIPVLQFDLGGRQFVILVEDDFLEMIDG